MTETDTTEVNTFTEDETMTDEEPTQEELQARITELENQSEVLMDFANSLFNEVQSLMEAVNKERELFQRRIEDLSDEDDNV